MESSAKPVDAGPAAKLDAELAAEVDARVAADVDARLAADVDARVAADVVAGLERLITLFRWLSSPTELSLTTVATLATLERSGPCRLTWLAASEGVTQPGMTQLISRLQDAGLVERLADPADGRAVRVRITTLGLTTLAARRAARAERLVGMLSQLNLAQRTALEAALPAIDALTRMQPDTRPTAEQPAS